MLSASVFTQPNAVCISFVAEKKLFTKRRLAQRAWNGARARACKREHIQLVCSSRGLNVGKLAGYTLSSVADATLFYAHIHVARTEMRRVKC